MKKALLLGIWLVLVGCGRTQVDPALVPYTQSFEQAYHLKLKDVVVKFGNLSNGTETDGDCEKDPVGASVINIDFGFWQGADDTQREMVLFHELGHCVFGRVHKMDLTPDGVFAVSLMYPDALMVGEQNYLANRDSYLKELSGR